LSSLCALLWGERRRNGGDGHHAVTQDLVRDVRKESRVGSARVCNECAGKLGDELFQNLVRFHRHAPAGETSSASARRATAGPGGTAPLSSAARASISSDAIVSRTSSSAPVSSKTARRRSAPPGVRSSDPSSSSSVA